MKLGIKNGYYLIGFGFVLVISSFLLLECAPKNSEDSSGGGNASSLAFPSGVAVSSPTSSTTTIFRAMTVDSNVPASEKTDALDALVGGTASSCAISVNLQNAGRANCYGPQLDYLNHPDANTASGQAPGGDLGIWEAAEAGSTACSAAQLNQQVGGVASQVDAGLFAAAGLICLANSSGKGLPGTDETVDLTTEIAGNITINGSAITVASATIAKTIDSNGNSVYTSVIDASPYYIRLKHIATASDNSTYYGKLSFTSNGRKTSILYSKPSATSVVYELKSGSSASYVSNSNYTVAFSSQVSNADYLLASYNPTDFSGTFLYAWQAGGNDSHTRVFNANISTTDGTTFFGFGPSITSGSDLGAISGMICNWAINGNTHVPVSFVQKQVLAVSGGVFTAASSQITYDPVNSCESSDSNFQFKKATSSTYTTANTTTKDLAPLTDVAAAITRPTAPAEVD